MRYNSTWGSIMAIQSNTVQSIESKNTTGEKDYIWISKIYDMLSMKRYIMDDLFFQYLAECAITHYDLLSMEKDGLIKIVDETIKLQSKIYDYIKPETLRLNWIYLEPMTRRRFIGNSAIPSVLDVIKESKGVDVNLEMSLEDVVKNDAIQIFLKYYNGVPNTQKFLNDIENYHLKRGRHIKFLSSIYLDEETIERISKKVHVIDTYETCPIGLDKDECEAMWKQDNGIETYAYKDFDIDGVNIRIRLARSHKGVFFTINPSESIDDRIGGYNFLKTLVDEGVVDMIRDARFVREKCNVYFRDYDIVFDYNFTNGFIPMFDKKNFLLHYFKEKPKSVSKNKKENKYKLVRYFCTNCSDGPCYTYKPYYDRCDAIWKADEMIGITWWLCQKCKMKCRAKRKGPVIPVGCKESKSSKWAMERDIIQMDKIKKWDHIKVSLDDYTHAFIEDDGSLFDNLGRKYSNIERKKMFGDIYRMFRHLKRNYDLDDIDLEAVEEKIKMERQFLKIKDLYQEWLIFDGDAQEKDAMYVKILLLCSKNRKIKRSPGQLEFLTKVIDDMEKYIKTV